MSRKIYIAGPMRGYPKYNFPAFDAARDRLKARGWEVVSPADMDRSIGFDPDKHEADEEFVAKAMERDLLALEFCNAIYLLNGYAQSSGAQKELDRAVELGLDVYMEALNPSPEPKPDKHDAYDKLCAIGEGLFYKLHATKQATPPASEAEDILDEAKRLTSGERNNAYGPPDEDFKRTAAMWSALKGVEFSPREVALFMICLKLSRETHQRKRDSAVDIAGYARCYWMCVESESKSK